MTLFFVVSPHNITHQIIPLLNEWKFDNLTVVTTEGLAPFFKNLNIKTIVPDVHPNLIDRHTKWHLIGNIIQANKEYKRLFSYVENDEIYLFFTSWAVVYLSYVAKLSKKNKVYLYKLKDDDDFTYKKVRGPKAFLMKWIPKLFLKVDTEIYDMAMSPAHVLKLDSIPLEIKVYDKFDTDLSNVFTDVTKFKDKEVLFLSSELETEGNNITDVINTTDYLYDILEEKYKDKYIVKGHPQNDIVYGKMSKSKNIISNKTIAETLLGHNWKFIISYYSEFLVSAKNQIDTTSISLLHLWRWKDLEKKQYMVEKYEKAEVLMPKTLEELKEMLI